MRHKQRQTTANRPRSVQAHKGHSAKAGLIQDNRPEMKASVQMLKQINDSTLVTQQKRQQASMQQSASRLPHPLQLQKTSQFDLNTEGEAYIDKLKNSRMWGGYPEAHAVSGKYGFKTTIFSVNHTDGGDQLQQMEEVGSGAASRFNLLWNGAHYMVIVGGADGGAVPQVDFNPTPDGNCLFAALHYIWRDGGPYWKRELHDTKEQEARASYLRGVAADELESNNPDLVNILGEELAVSGKDLSANPESRIGSGSKPGEKLVQLNKVVLQLYKKYPPKDYMFKTEKKTETMTPRDSDTGSATKLSVIFNRELDLEVVLGKGYGQKDKKHLQGSVTDWLKSSPAYGAVPLVKGDLETNMSNFEMMSSGNYSILPPEDGLVDAETNKPSYDGLRQCVLQGISHVMEEDESMMDTNGALLYQALYGANAQNPWYAFKNYTDDAVNPVFFTWLGFSRVADYDGMAVESLEGAAEPGWYLLVTTGHVEGIKVTSDDVEIYDPARSNERHKDSKKRTKTLLTTRKDKVLMLFKQSTTKTNYQAMLKAGKQ